jgi:putative PIG3 family NAD(P)H quinone oxidoreductase
MRCIVFRGAGGNEVVSLTERPTPEPGTGEVRVRVRYAGMNPADANQRAGRYPAPPGSPPDIPGLEVSGTIEAVGPGVVSRRLGERVFGLIGGGGLADRVIVHERCVAPVPDTLGDVEAAAVPEAFVTAHDAVRTRGRLTAGETLLAHGAGGGVGSAAIQIALAGGSRAIGVVRSDAVAAAVEGLGAEVVRDAGFADAALAATDGDGVDVVLETVGGPHLEGDLRALAMRGRIVIVGVGSGASAELSLIGLMGRRGELHGTLLRSRSLEDKALAIRAFERELLPALAAGRVRPLIDSTFPAERFAEAFDRLEGRGKTGKVLLDFGG